MTAPTRPPTNVLVVMADEYQHRALACAGHPLVQTPNLDALAAKGVRFTNCWTPSPICVPARASFATGRWVHQVGGWDSTCGYDGEPEGWAHRMASAGYDVVSFGKLHHRAPRPESPGDGFTESILPMYLAGGEGWVQGLARRDPFPYPEAAELAADIGVGHTSYTRYDERVADAATSWLRDRGPNRSDPPTKPWVAFVSFVAPHYPLSAPQEFSDLYPLADIPPPEIPPTDIDHPAVAAVRDFFNYGAYFDAETMVEARRAYFALCSWADHLTGQLLDALEASGCSGQTRIIFTSDHGEMAGNRGLWCKSFLFQDSIRVPLIAAGPGLSPGVVDANVSLVDIGASITDVVGQPRFGVGHSLWSVARGETADRPAFTEYHDGGSITGSFAVQVDQWKYVEHVDYQPQLFNLADDPDELIDLGQDGRTGQERSRLADVLRSIVNPEDANRRAFDDQERKIAALGGRAAVAAGFRFNHTPVPE